MRYDVVVAGGSIAGLLCAREAAASGHSVMVLERDHEIGTPEHCSGLVSSDGLARIGLEPGRAREIRSARVFAPNMASVTISAKKGILDVSRRGIDKQAARQAQKNGALVRTGAAVRALAKDHVTTADRTIPCKVAVDARGLGQLAQNKGSMPSAQYEICADWIPDMVQIYMDQKKYPGFFAWIIPTGRDTAKAGVAGYGIEPVPALDKFLAGLGRCSVLRRVVAPVWVGGPTRRFVADGIVAVGDAAGQTKPTTGGGIYSAGMGGVLAGRAISRFLQSGNRGDLDGYGASWRGLFGAEFSKQGAIRNIAESLDNASINAIISSITPEVANRISSDDFDFHATALLRVLGARGTARAAGAVASGGMRRLLGRKTAGL